jgi:CDP-paratose 2-epimerase
MDVLVTGSSGLIGSEAVVFYDGRGARVWGVDNNMRADFFGPGGDTTWNLQWLKENTSRFEHVAIDIRDRGAVMGLFERQRFDLVIHCAAQPSHDLAAKRPFDDFEVNALGTLNLLEATRQHCPEAVFAHMSTNKVYGDAPNERELVELPTRYDYARPEDHNGIDETCRIDRCLHSLFGASKTAGDIVAQEYGRYFGMKVGVFRGGCLTGCRHSGVELHGFLSYIVKACVRGMDYTIFGYKGKQVRDQIDSQDVLAAIDAFRTDPKPGEVYNIGGGRENGISILETVERLADLTGKRLPYTYRDEPRRGDHICYISDLSKLRSHFPAWRITRSLDVILEEMVKAEQDRVAAG